MLVGLIAALLAAGVVLGLLARELVRARRRRKHRDLFAAYAAERGLEVVDEEIPEVTPILGGQNGRTTGPAIKGELAEGLTGSIAHYLYAAAGGTTSALTIVLVEVPETFGVFPKLLCHGRVKSQRTDDLDDRFRADGTKRLELESEALDRRFEVFFDPRDDEVRLRRLFSPSFMFWLAESMPTAFELVNGHLCCFAAGHLDSATELDTLIWGAAELAYRLESEATE